MSEQAFSIRQASWPEDRELLRQVREPVFVEEQGVPLEMEWDDDDIMAFHLVALDSQQQPVGTARLLGNGQIGRMAVLPAWRGKGIGTALLDRLLAQAQADGMQKLFLHAQADAQAFYSRAGFHPVGKLFQEADIAHRKMIWTQDGSKPAEPEIELELPQLGESDELFHLHTEADHLIHAAGLLRQTKRELALFTHDLDPAVFDQLPFLEAFKALAMRSRHSRLRILLQDNTLVLQRGHRLVELAQRLPSVVEIRRPYEDYLAHPENFLLADDSGYLHKRSLEGYSGIACYHNRHRVNRLLAVFDEAWEHGTPDRELARLHL